MRKAALLLLLLLVGQLALGAAGLVEGAPPAEGAVIHVVQRGETLFSIARRYGTTVGAITQANGLSDASTIYAGQHLVIPSPAASTPSLTGNQYIVRPGDTLIAIALRFGTSPAAIAQANNLRHPSLLYVGQRLVVPGAAKTAQSRKRIEIDISDQRLTAWEGETLVYHFICSTGLPGYPTRRGRFQVLDKIPMAYSSPWNLWMPHWLGIYWAGGSENGIHALPIINGKKLWEGHLGRPISYGCIVLSTEAAEVLYNWAEIGIPVAIHD